MEEYNNSNKKCHERHTKLILSLLKKQKSFIAGSKLGFLLRINYNSLLQVLKQLEKENKITKISNGRYNFYQIKSGDIDVNSK